MISIIVCADRNGAIGRNNELLGHFPADLRRFRELTTGKTCIMGRKTFDSIVKMNGEPLPDRQSLVLTSSPDYSIADFYEDDVYFFEDIDELIPSLTWIKRDKEVMICGGESIYKQFLPVADRIYLTVINEVFDDADTFFPIDLISDNGSWRLSMLERVEDVGGYKLDFMTCERERD